MLGFLIVYLVVYVLVNLYAFRWFKPAFGWGRRQSIIFITAAGLMFVFSILGRVLDQADYFQVSRILAMPSYLWMLVLMWTVSFGLVAELWNFCLKALAAKWQGARKAIVTPGRFITILAALAAILSAWGVFEASSIRLRVVPLFSERLQPGSQPVRLLQISDLHASPFVGSHFVDKVVKLSRASKPDVVVATGDLFDSHTSEMMILAQAMRGIEAPFGKFAVTGNHEFYIGIDWSTALLRNAGFKVLRGESVLLLPHDVPLILAGVDDSASRMLGQRNIVNEQHILPGPGKRPFTVLLKHRPVVDSKSLGRFDLQLSGHTHGGQVFPFNCYVWLFYPMSRGLHTLPEKEKLHVSPGVGTWGPTMRVFSKPEITLFVISPAAKVSRPAPAEAD